MVNLENILARLYPECKSIVREILNKVEIVKAYKIPVRDGYVIRIDIKVKEDK